MILSKSHTATLGHSTRNIMLVTWQIELTLDNDQLNAQFFNTFITILYMYMFWTISCSFLRDQIVLTQHLVSSLSVSDRPVHLCTGRSLTESDDTRCCVNCTCASDGHLLRVTIPDAVLIQFDLLTMRKILLKSCTCRGS
jgi:hypothetical protein